MKLDFIKEKHDIENTIKKYTNTISKIAYSYTKSKETAEDITQNVFLKYMISEHTFHDDEHKKAWLIRVTINECKKHFRWLSYQPKSYPKTPEPEEYHDVYSAVMDLPQNYRMVIHLHYYEGLSVKEMSSILEKNENTILSHLHRARKKLKKIMEVDYEYKYKYAMDSIKMKEFTVEELENILIKKRRRSKQIGRAHV